MGGDGVDTGYGTKSRNDCFFVLLVVLLLLLETSLNLFLKCVFNFFVFLLLCTLCGLENQTTRHANLA